MQEIKRAVLTRVQAKGGRAVPDELIDFVASAQLHCFDAQGQPVALDRIIVTWEG